MSEEYDDPKGGEQRYEGDGPNLRYDDFVGRIVQDPNVPPNVTLLSGYLGASSEEGHVRLYLDEELSRYVEIPEKNVRHTQELPPEQSPLGGSLVWIDNDAEVLHGPVGSERRRATFLEGQIAQDYIGGAGDYTATGGITTQTRACVVPLPTILPGCGQSRLSPCIPKTEVQYCRTLTGIFCTRFGPGCRRTIFEPHCTFAGPLCGRSVYYPCVTVNEPRCVASGFVCNPLDFTIWEDQFGQQQFGQQAFAMQPTQTNACYAGPGGVGIPTQTPDCRVGGGGGGGGQEQPSHFCPFTAYSGAPSCVPRRCYELYDPVGPLYPGRAAQPSQYVRCPSALDACPTRYNCPTLPNGCPGYTRRGACETYGPCPSAVDACPTRFGCYETAVCGGQSVACYPGGGGGGFDPGGFGGGF